MHNLIAVNGPSKTFRLVVLLGVLLMATGCAVKISYTFLDNLLEWQLGRYVNLDKEQERTAERTFKAFHQWHRKTQLPLYIDYLEALKTELLKKNVSADYLHRESDKLQDMLDDSVAELLPGLTQIASTLDPDQIEQVTEKLSKDRDDYSDDYIDTSIKKRKKERIRDITKYIGPFFGRFTVEQTTLLDEWESTLADHEPLMLVQHMNWQKEFLHAMQYQTQTEVLFNHLKELMIYRTDNWDSRLQEQLDINQDLTFAMLAKMFNSQTPKQQKKLESKFNQYIDDFRDLHDK